MSTVREEIDGALRLIGQLAQGETPSDDDYAEALSAFIERLRGRSL